MEERMNLVEAELIDLQQRLREVETFIQNLKIAPRPGCGAPTARVLQPTRADWFDPEAAEDYLGRPFTGLYDLRAIPGITDDMVLQLQSAGIISLCDVAKAEIAQLNTLIVADGKAAKGAADHFAEFATLILGEKWEELAKRAPKAAALKAPL